MKKLFFLLSMMSSIMSPCSAYAADGGTSGDEKNRLFLQADMGKYAPFTKDFLIHTHNSYNNDEDWYVDPAHGYNITKQLERGVRYLELDIWTRYSTVFFVVDDIWPILCHGGICGAGDTKLKNSLSDINAFLESNPDEVIVIRFEDHTSDFPAWPTWFNSDQKKAYKEVVDIIDSKLGSKVFKPEVECGDVHSEVFKKYSRADIRARGKNIVLFGEPAAKTNFNSLDIPDCGDSMVGDWGEWIHTGNPNISEDYDAGVSYDDAIACDFNGDGVSDIDNINSEFYRSYNDFAVSSHGQSTITSSKIKKLVGCGINAPGPEPFGGVEDKDIDYDALIWSWHSNEPNDHNSNEDCAHVRPGGRLNDSACSNSFAYACQHLSNLDWKITENAGVWSDGGIQCRAEFGDDYIFSLPTNGYYMNTLEDAAAGEKVWINYSDVNAEGDWEPMALDDGTTLGSVVYVPFDQLASGRDNNGATITPWNAVFGLSDLTATTGHLGDDEGAFYFNGTSSYWKALWNQSLENEVTLSLWFKSDSSVSMSNSAPLVAFSEHSHVASAAIAYETDGSLKAWCTDRWEVPWGVIEPTTTFNDDAWHRVAYVNSSGGATLYVDGTVVGTSSDSCLDDFEVVRYLGIGTDANLSPVGSVFSGSIDDVRIYARALSASEILDQIGTQITAQWDASKCLNAVGNNSTQNGAGVNLYDCSASTERWYLGEDQKIHAAWDGDMCLNVIGNNSTANGKSANIYNCDNVTETWTFESDGKIHATWDDDMCLNIIGNNSSSNGQGANLYTCDNVTETWSWPAAKQTP